MSLANKQTALKVKEYTSDRLQYKNADLKNYSNFIKSYEKYIKEHFNDLKHTPSISNIMVNYFIAVYCEPGIPCKISSGKRIEIFINLIN